MEVAVGIDTHKRSLAAAAVDALGRVLDVWEFTNDPPDTGSWCAG